MMKISIFTRKVLKGNKTFLIKETCDFGYKLSISTKLQPVVEQDGNTYLYYDPMKAFIKTNEEGYLTLYIKD